MPETEFSASEAAAAEAAGPEPRQSAWGSYSFFGTSPSEPSADRGGARPEPGGLGADPARRADVDCWVLGRPSAGKTSLIAALEPGCLSEGTAERHINLVGGPAFASLSAAARAEERQGRAFRPEPTRGSAVYDFEAGCRNGDRFEPGIQVRLTELPAAVFDYASIARVSEPPAPITSVAICLDLADPGAIADWLDQLPSCLARLAPAERASRPVRWLLSFDRLLLVFTKADLLVEGVQQELARSAQSSLGSCRELLARIDPLELLLQLAGRQTLTRILRALDPGTKLAVVLTSAWGENREGRRRAEWQPVAVGAAVDFLVRGVESEEVVAFGATALDDAAEPGLGFLEEPQR